MMQKSIKAVGFDVDGTLYHIPSDMYAELGKLVIAEAARQLSRDPDEFAEEYLCKREIYRGNTLTLNAFGLKGQEIFQKIVDNFSIEKYVGVDAKLVKLIKELKRKYKLFLITNGTGRQVERKLKLVGLDYHDFDPRIYCYDQGWVKPEPAPFLAAIESLGLKPEEIVYVGDRADIDIEGARAVGMRTILIGGSSDLADESCPTVYDVGLMLG